MEPGVNSKPTSIQIRIDGLTQNGRGLFNDVNVSQIKIRVSNTSRVVAGEGSLTKGTSHWSGNLVLSSVGSLRFSMVALDVNGNVLYAGTASTTVVDGAIVTIPAAPASQSITAASIINPLTIRNIGAGGSIPITSSFLATGITEVFLVDSTYAGVDVGLSTVNENPALWEETLWTPLSFKTPVLDNSEHEFSGNIGSDKAIGTYYYATRVKLKGGAYVYGANGGIWNGTSNNNGVFNVVNVPTSLAIIGDAVGGWANDKFTLAKDSDSSFTAITYFSVGEFKLRTPGTWGGDICGKIGLIGNTPMAGGITAFPAFNLYQSSSPDNIPITTAGTYILRIDFLKGLIFVIPVTSFGLIGSGIPSGWAAQTNMTSDTLTDIFTFTGPLSLGEFVFRANDSWDLNWGSNHLIAQAATGIAGFSNNKDNITIGVAGSGTITFNGRTMTFTHP